MSSSSGGFWPADETEEAPEGDERAYHDFEELPAEEAGAAEPAVTEPEPEQDPEPELDAEAEPEPKVEPTFGRTPEPEPEFEDDMTTWALPDADPVPVIAHRPGEIDV